MFRQAARPAVQAARAAAPAARDFSASATQNATLREIEGRLKSVRNIEKITKSMKMIASTKLARAQRAMNTAKVYGESNQELFKNAEASEAEGGKKLYVTISSDSGLCGGIHSGLTKYTKRAIAAEGGDAETGLVVVGDRSRNQLQRSNAQNLRLTFNQIGKQVPTFGDAAAIADTIIKSDVEFDQINIVYNKFVSAISYEPAVFKVFNEQALVNAPNFKAYELEEDVTKDFAEFALANAIYAALVEGHASEISARRNAMDNASKNAGDMIGSLQMQFNRGRQAVITNELIDIITGASAL